MKFLRPLGLLISLAILALICYVPAPPTVRPGLMALAATPPGATIVRCQDLVANTGSGLTFTWSGSAQTCSNNNLIISRATFVSWIKNNGSCAGGANSTYYQMTWNDMVACAVNTASLHSVTIAAGSMSSNTTCTFNSLQDRTSCGVPSGSFGETTIATTSASTVAPTSSSTQISISLTGLSHSDDCGASADVIVVKLYNTSNTNVASWNIPTASTTWSTTWSGAGAASGAYHTTINNNEAASIDLQCASGNYGAGSFAESVGWTGSSMSSYY